MRNALFILLSLSLISISDLCAQQPNVEIEKEINEQVWQVFKTSYQARNSEMFRSIHLQDVLRVHDGGVRLGYEYHQDIANWRPMPAGRSLLIDFAFQSRKYKDTVGYEVGFYRVISQQTGMESIPSYGMFHVVLKKADGQWKIAQDFDTSLVGSVKIDGSFFEEAEFLQLK